jgi:hypothetical protein
LRKKGTRLPEARFAGTPAEDGGFWIDAADARPNCFTFFNEPGYFRKARSTGN